MQTIFNIKSLGVSEEIFMEIMGNYFSELKTELNLQIQRASRKIRNISSTLRHILVKKLNFNKEIIF